MTSEPTQNMTYGRLSPNSGGHKLVKGWRQPDFRAPVINADKHNFKVLGFGTRGGPVDHDTGLRPDLPEAPLPQPPNPLRRGLQVLFQRGEAFAKFGIESRFAVQAAQEGLGQRQGLAPLDGADLAVEAGGR